jgi:c-di-GMP-related signal transduction protein
MLGVSMEDILGQMPLDDAVVQGLTGESELRQMIGLVQCYERGDWDETVKRLKVLGLNAEEGDGLYVRSRAWAQQMLGVSKADGSQDDEEK